MTDLSKTSIRLSGDRVRAKTLANTDVVRELQIFRALTALGNLNQNSRVVRYDDGSVIQMQTTFGLEVVEVYVPPLLAKEKEKRELRDLGEEFYTLMPQIVLDDPTASPAESFVNVVLSLQWGLFRVQIKEDDQVDLKELGAGLIPEVPSESRDIEIATLDQLHKDKGLLDDEAETVSNSNAIIVAPERWSPFLESMSAPEIICDITGLTLGGPNLAGTYINGSWLDPYPHEYWAFADYSAYSFVPITFPDAVAERGLWGYYVVYQWFEDEYGNETPGATLTKKYPDDTLTHTWSGSTSTTFSSSVTIFGSLIATGGGSSYSSRDIEDAYGINGLLDD